MLIFISFSRTFESRRPERKIVQSYIDRMRHSFGGTQTQASRTESVFTEFCHDVLKYLFSGRGRAATEENWTLLEETDFNKCKLPNNGVANVIIMGMELLYD